MKKEKSDRRISALGRITRGRKYLLSIIAVAVAALALTGSQDSYYYKLDRAFDMFGAVFREISANYIEEIDPEIIAKHAINGVMVKLDPYSSFFDEEESEEFEDFTRGSYVGLGITVGTLDSMLTVTDVRGGYPAQKAGIRIGDRLYQADSVVVLRESSIRLRDFTKGEPGTILDLRIIRDGLDDTLSFAVERERIEISCVPFYTVLRDSVGYLILDSFSADSYYEFAAAVEELVERRGAKALIVDLRNNPGGLLRAAVEICEMFAPEGGEIVTTKGRSEYSQKTYEASREPLYPDLPLSIIINENSASASEIVAGAMQDLDRGVIVGRRSYGKGLVQTVFDLPDGASLKLTTSKYYTPSGRCIQKLEYVGERDFSRANESEIDTVEFFTKNGRVVLEYMGILPDTIIPREPSADFIYEIRTNNAVFNFANVYAASLDSLPKDFRADDKALARFSEFLLKNKKKFVTGEEVLLEKLLDVAKSDSLPPSLIKKIDELSASVRKHKVKMVEKFKDILIPELEREIRLRFDPGSIYSVENLEKDDFIRTAADVLTPQNYGRILGLKRLAPGKNE